MAATARPGLVARPVEERMACSPSCWGAAADLLPGSGSSGVPGSGSLADLCRGNWVDSKETVAARPAAGWAAPLGFDDWAGALAAAVAGDAAAGAAVARAARERTASTTA